MKSLFSKKLVGAAALALLLLLSVSGDAMAQGRGRGRGHGRGGFDLFDRKCGKFVNCHDARDGRWDGRGPRRNREFRRARFWRRHRNHR